MSPLIEDRLRDAFAAGAELVRAETLRPELVRAPRRGFVLAVPLAAALVVVVIGAVVAAVAGVRAQAPAGPAAKVLSGPRFLLAVGDGEMAVRDARTGKITSRVELPRSAEGSLREPGGYLLAGTGEGTTFYVAQSVSSREVSTTWFHRVRVDERGKVAELARDVIPAVTGTTASSLAVTVDGTRLAYSLDGEVCGADKTLRFCPGARLTVVDLPKGTARTWTTNAAGQITNLSWAADRRVLGFIARSEARILDTAATGATLAVSRVVAPGREVTASAISPDGRSMLIARTHLSDGERPHRYTVDEYSVSDGRELRTLLSADRYGQTIAWWDLIRYDATGRHLLVVGNHYPLSRLDDGQVTPLLHHGPADARLADASPPRIEAAW